MNFTIHCFDIPFIKTVKGHKDIEDTKLWKIIENEEPGLKNAKGAYIFALKRGRGYRPFYVGKTNNSFYQEAFQSHKLLHYEKCINKEHGKPIIIFVAARTGTNKFSTINNDKLFSSLETYLINLACTCNTNLLNTAKTKFIKEIVVPGLLNSPKGKPNAETCILKRVLSVK